VGEEVDGLILYSSVKKRTVRMTESPKKERII